MPGHAASRRRMLWQDEPQNVNRKKIKIHRKEGSVWNWRLSIRNALCRDLVACFCTLWLLLNTFLRNAREYVMKSFEFQTAENGTSLD